MQITFGMFLDGAQWSAKPASLGEITCGPQTFLTLLEQRTGLSGINTPEPERINEYMQKIAAVNPPWCRTSFQLDSWSTAKQMLSMRDELYLNGWNGTDAPSKRLKALAQIEENALPLSAGTPDRMKRLLAELPNFAFFDTLYLQDEQQLLPSYWQKIIGQLVRCGMTVIPIPNDTRNHPEIYKIHGNNEYVLAVEAARYLNAPGDNAKTAVICEDKSIVLDGALRRSGLGMIGNVQASRWRESLQVLPLWLNTMWKPFNPLRFLELLSLPCSPIPSLAARELSCALQKTPGIGGEEWNNAWNNISDIIRKNQYGFYKDIDAECKKFTDLRSFLENECFNNDPDTGVLEKTLISRCEYLEKRLAVQIENNPEMAIVHSHVQTLKKISIGKGLINKVALARMLDSIVSTGTVPAGNHSQSTTFKVFTHPGMVSGDFDTVLWWNCIDKKHSAGINWTDDEIKVLPGFNRQNPRLLENNAWQRAKNSAKTDFIAFIPQAIEGEAVFSHALLDDPEIAAVKKINSEELVKQDGLWELGSRKIKLSEKEQFFPPVSYFDQENDIKTIRHLSYSQMNTFLSCPRQWFFQDYLSLKMPAAMNMPTGETMFGSLAHKVVELLYHGKEKISVDDAKQNSGKIFDRLVTEMAAELLIDENKLKKHRFRETLINSICSLVRVINDNKLLVKSCEKELHGSFFGIDFIGFCDLYLEDEMGNPFVIDMKWSTSNYYENKLKENKALQLATYSWLLRPENMNIQCAYYLFPKHQLVRDPNADWKVLWGKARQCWIERMDALHTGKLEKGIDDEKKLADSPLSLPLTAGCAFCKFAALCNIIEE